MLEHIMQIHAKFWIFLQMLEFFQYLNLNGFVEAFQLLLGIIRIFKF